MAEEKVVVSVEVNSDKAGKSLADLKREFKEAGKELSGLTQGTKEYYEALKKLGKVKDEMGDLRDTIESFKPDQKLKALGNAVTVVASGFTAVQGAMALFGTESKDLEKTLVKVQAAMAFSQGLQGLQGLGDAFQLLKANLMQFTIFQKLATAAQWLWNIAMEANPIGLLVAGIAALVGGIALLVNSQDDEAEAIERTNELRKKAIADREKEIGLIKQQIDVISKVGDFELEIAKAQGKSKEELYLLEKANIEQRIKNLSLMRDAGRDLTAQEYAEQGELRKKLALLTTKYVTDKHNEFVKAQEDATKKNKEELEKQHKANLEAYEKRADAENAFIDAKEAKAKKDKEDKAKQDVVDAQVEIDQWLDIETFKANEKKRLRDEDKANELQHFKDMIKLATDVNESLMALSDIYFSFKKANLKKGTAEEERVARQQFNINKALQLSSAIINGINATQAQLAAAPLVIGGVPNPLAIAAFAKTILTSAANVAKIASTKFQSTSGGASSVGGGGGDVSAPTISAPRNDSTLLDANGGVIQKPKNGNGAIKAYVVETEMTKTQRNVSRIEQNAKL